MPRPRVVLVPGFTQTASSWARTAAVVRESCAVRALDVPEPGTLASTARAIGIAGRAGIYIGYSMGGRLALRLALDQPELVHGLMLISTSPGIVDPSERSARVAADELLAQGIERDGVHAFLEQWLAQPMFAGVPADAPGLADRRRLTPQFLTSCLRRLGTGAMEPMWHRLGDLAMPVTLVTGTRDEKFTQIAHRMLERMHPGVRHVQLDGGHALPLEQPEVLGGLITAFATEHA